MGKLPVIHRAGMNVRGKVWTEIVVPMKLPSHDEHIRRDARAHGAVIGFGIFGYDLALRGLMELEASR